MIVLKILFPIALLWMLLWWGGLADGMGDEAAGFATAALFVLAGAAAALVGICLLGVWIYE